MLNFKKKLVFYFSIVAIILLLINVVWDLFKKKNYNPDARELSKIELENIFWKTLDAYGIKANWVTKKKFHQADEDSISYQFIVTIPQDLPIPLIIKDINNIIRKDISASVSEEKKFFGDTELRIYSNEYLKLKALLIPDKNIVRDNKEISFLILDAMNLSDDDYKMFLFSKYPLCAVIVPDPENIPKADSLSKYSKEYSLILNNDIDDSKMKLSQEFGKEILKKSIKTILESFPKRNLIFVDENSTLFNSPIYNYVRDVFKSNGKIIYHMSECIKLDQTDEEEMFSKLKFYIEDTTTNQKLFYTSFENFRKMIPVIEQYKKKGGKIIPVSRCYLALKGL